MSERNGVDATGLYVDPENRGPSIRLVNGARLFLLDPDPDIMGPDIIAHALGMLCRYTGHVRSFYSVAQHSVMVSRLVPAELALDGLLHDATEAFMGDLSRPLKVTLDQLAPGIVREFEDTLHRALSERYGVAFPLPPEVKVADNVALSTEMRDLLAPTEDALDGLPEPLPDRVWGWAPDVARRAWLERYEELLRA